MATTVTVDLLVSLDGFAGSDGLPGFFGYLGPDLEEWLGEESTVAHVALLGRKTHEVLAAIPEEDHGPAWGATDKVVFSRTLKSTAWANTRICDRDAVDEVRAMKADGELPMQVVGSLSIGRQLLAAGLVDRVRVMTFPLLAGPHGREPAFAGVDCADLDLAEHRVLDGRIVLLEYRPTGQDIPRG